MRLRLRTRSSEDCVFLSLLRDALIWFDLIGAVRSGDFRLHLLPYEAEVLEARTFKKCYHERPHTHYYFTSRMHLSKYLRGTVCICFHDKIPRMKSVWDDFHVELRSLSHLLKDVREIQVCPKVSGLKDLDNGRFGRLSVHIHYSRAALFSLIKFATREDSLESSGAQESQRTKTVQTAKDLL